MAIDHASLTGADLHEPKGVASAPAGAYPVFDGAGGSNFQKMPRLITVPGSTEVTLTTPTVYTAIECPNGGSAADYLCSATEDTGITSYTGDESRQFVVTWSAMIRQTDTSAQDIYICIAKNGVVLTNYQVAYNQAQNDYKSASQSLLMTLTKNDALQLYGLVAAGNLKVTGAVIHLAGFPY